MTGWHDLVIPSDDRWQCSGPSCSAALSPGLSPTDPCTFATVSVLLAAIGICACLVFAIVRRASSR